MNVLALRSISSKVTTIVTIQLLLLFSCHYYSSMVYLSMVYLSLEYMAGKTWLQFQLQFKQLSTLCNSSGTESAVWLLSSSGGVHANRVDSVHTMELIMQDECFNQVLN